MKAYILILPLISLLCSCGSREYIELRHRNYLKLYNDEVVIKITPLKNKDSVFVKANYNEKAIKKEKFRIVLVKKSTDNYITTDNFKKIVDFFNAIKAEDLKQSRMEKDSITGLISITYIGADAGGNSIIYKNKAISKKYNVRGMSDLYKSYYEAAMLIVEAAKLSKSNIF